MKAAMAGVKQARLWSDEFWGAVNPEVFNVGFHKAVPGWISPVMSSVQTDFDLWYVAVGSGGVRIDGAWHGFEAGDLIAIKPGQDYQQERTERATPFQIYYAHVLPFGRKERRLSEALARVWPLKISLLHRPDCLSVFNQLFEAHATRPVGYPLAVRGLTLQLLRIIFEELQKSPVKPSRSHANLLRAKERIEADFAKDLKLEGIAEGCGLSPSHLSALFTRHLGLPPIEYLLEVRLREAKVRLARGARVKEVAEAVGFHSQHYFSRLFRKRTGMSPVEFTLLHARK